MDFKKELSQIIIEKEAKFDLNKTKRALLALLIMFAGNTVFFYFLLSRYEGNSIHTLLEALALSFVYCSLTFLGYVFLFWKWFKKNQTEEKALQTMKDILSKTK